MTKAQDENGNGNGRRNLAKMVVPITAVGAFISFGIGAGAYVRGIESDKAALEKRVTQLELRLSEIAAEMLSKDRFSWWVESFKRDPTHPPEAPR